MNNIKLIFISCCLNTLVGSCSQLEQDNTSETSNKSEKLLPSNEEKLKENKGDKPLKLITKGNNKHLQTDTRKVSFNGEKYFFNGEKLQKGSRVRHVFMTETGTITGSFVVVAKAGEVLNFSSYDKVQIAKDTYRIFPAQTEDLMTVYENLLLNESIIQVEVEIEYGARKASHY